MPSEWSRGAERLAVAARYSSARLRPRDCAKARKQGSQRTAYKGRQSKNISQSSRRLIYESALLGVTDDVLPRFKADKVGAQDILMYDGPRF
jgi:hypothetical protein